MAAKIQRKRRLTNAAPAATEKRRVAANAKRPAQRMATRRSINDKTARDFRKRLFKILGEAVSEKSREISGAETAVSTGYTASQISMLSNGKKYIDTFSLENLVSMLLNFYEVRVIIAKNDAIAGNRYNMIRVNRMLE